jgi:ParB family chromosome partitioning protein
MPFFSTLMNKPKSPEVLNKVVSIHIDKIARNPYQPRQEFGDLEELAESIRQNGILQPLTVREIMPGSYELIAGERRLRAAKLAGLDEVPSIIVQMTDRGSAVMSLVENIQRKDLNFFDEAEAIAKLIDLYGMTQEDAALRLGKSQPTIANKLRLLRLSPEERKKISVYGLTERHARALLKLTDPIARAEAIENIRLKKLNVEHSERLIDGMLIRAAEQEKTAATIRRTNGLFKDVRLFVNTINHAVEVMRSAGIEAEQTKVEHEEFIEYTIKIPR